MAYDEFYKAREKIVDILQKDLIGPMTPDETLHETPERYYIMGKLYPQRNESLETTDTSSEGKPVPMNGEENQHLSGSDDPLSDTNALRQSSAGITFALKAGIQDFLCKVFWATYQHIDEPVSPDGKKEKDIWKRKQEEWIDTLKVPSTNYGSRYILLKNNIFVHMHWIRNAAGSKDTVVTLTVINKNLIEDLDKKEIKEKTNESIMFQVSLSVEGKGYIFAKIPEKEGISNDKEKLQLQLLYHDCQCFGQGHGCSVEWDLEQQNNPKWIRMAFMPKYNLKQMRPVIFEGNKCFNMKFLMEGNAQEVIGELNQFIAHYEAWIANNKKNITRLDASLTEIANENIKKCMYALGRIKRSVKILQDSAEATGSKLNTWKAFRLTNKVMYMQRKQSAKKNSEKELKDKDINWYPFQLAFFLQEIAPIVNPKDTDRNIVDLLWFPTGGGKTEAYLGIAAFVIILRRLCNQNDETTAVLMRYTLRLLTLQQFERASMMIMACNAICREEGISNKEIGIGLWVGNGLTPNKLSDADNYLENAKHNALYSIKEQSGTPCLIKLCPWCGQHIYEEDYIVDYESQRLKIYCTNPECISHRYGNGLLPIHLVDEDIYANKPTFIVSTVDKFAQLPKNGKAATLFDREHSAPNNPPELIIQDEMHLISGPLGSMVGLYETAIDVLCTDSSGIGPKIIASTATVSNAEYQIEQLYGRRYAQFPPQCITAKDSFFAKESDVATKPARLYCGIINSSATLDTTLIRLQADLFFSSRELLYHYKIKPNVVDNYWTTVSYFNTIKDLGNFLTQLEDDVRARYKYLRDTKFKDFNGLKEVEYPMNFVELTSRKSASDIASVLSRLEYSISNPKKAEEVIDCVASTNMISVGVDVSRLGNMIVKGQPKTNSEYIQATSRVGRKNPGLVITLYNGNHSRDRSHYEQFLKYHSGMYRYVEATSVTPFSDQAVIKGIHAVFVTLCRYLDPKLLPNDGTKNFDPNLPVVKKALSCILNRVYSIDPGAIDVAEERLKAFIEYWEENKDTFSYTKRKAGDKYYLLKNDTSGEEYSTMNSMRTVDETSGVYIFNN